MEHLSQMYFAPCGCHGMRAACLASLSVLISTAVMSHLWSGSTTIHRSQLFWLKEPQPITCLAGGWEYRGDACRHHESLGQRESGNTVAPSLKIHFPDTWPSLAPLETK